MKVFRRTMAALAGLLLTCGACRAQDPVSVWSVWETSAVERRGPASAAGLLLYFHGYAGLLDITQFPMSQLFAEMATVAGWDVLRINRLPTADLEPDDDNILRFVADRITMARQVGYKQIIVAGERAGPGGWRSWQRRCRRRCGDRNGAWNTKLFDGRPRAIARPAGAKADRCQSPAHCSILFRRRFGRGRAERRAVAIRRALQGTRSAFLVVDRPVDFYGHSAAGRAGFIRRYLGCLREFAESANPPAGNFNALFPHLPPPRGSRPMPIRHCTLLGALAGRRRDRRLFDPAGRRHPGGQIVFQVVHSDRPAGGFEETMGERAFELDAARRRIFCRIGKKLDLLFATPRSATELDVELIKSDATGTILGRSRAVLRKQGEEAAR
jgi:hypothetical protein